jgi:hypothetical protein
MTALAADMTATMWSLINNRWHRINRTRKNVTVEHLLAELPATLVIAHKYNPKANIVVTYDD